MPLQEKIREIIKELDTPTGVGKSVFYLNLDEVVASILKAVREELPEKRRIGVGGYGIGSKGWNAYRDELEKKLGG